MQLHIGPRVQTLIDLALSEDEVGYDVTSAAFFGDEEATAHIVARHRMVVCGAPVAEAVFRAVDDRNEWRATVDEGDVAEEDDIIAEVSGPAGALLRAERAALNFLQRMCGVATFTAEHVEAADSQGPKVVDTRKTLPGWRLLDKYAVRCGGGYNHRFNLAGGVLIKENHIAAAGGTKEAIERISKTAPHSLRVEIEVERLDQIEVALDAGADVVMLDNMTDDTMRTAVDRIRSHRRGDEIVIEASGNMDRSRLERLDVDGIDVVSVGALTHSAKAADLSMRVV